MRDQTIPPVVGEEVKPADEKAPEAKAPEEKKVEPTPKDDTESRINQLLARAKTAEEENKIFKAKEAQVAEDKMLKSGEHEKLLNEYKGNLETANEKLQRMDVLEASLKTHLDSQVALIPEERKSLIPESFSVEEKLKYISENHALLMGDKKLPSTGNPLPKGEVKTSEIDALEKKFDDYKNKVNEGGSLNHMESTELRAIPAKIKALKETV